MILYRCVEQLLGELVLKSLIYADEPGLDAEAEELPHLMEGFISNYTGFLVNLIANLEDEEISAVRNVRRELDDVFFKAMGIKE